MMTRDRKVVLDDNYGPFKRFQVCEVREEGLDWFRLRNKGKSYYVGKHLMHPDPENFIWNQKEAEYNSLEEEESSWDDSSFNNNY